MLHSRLLLVVLLAVTACGAAGAAGSDAEAGGSPARDAPIHVTFVIHFDPLPAPQGEVARWGYEAERDNLAWLAGLLERIERERGKEFVPRLTLEMAGDHAEWYLEDETGLELLRRLHAKGIHSFGTHFHTNYKAAPHRWLPAQASPHAARKVTADHVAEVDRLVGRLIGSDDPKAIRRANHTITGHYLDQGLAAEMGFDTLTGGRNEALNLFFDHDVYHPWRPALGWPLSEDRSSTWVLVPQAPVLGVIGEHAPIPRGVPEEYTRGMRRMIWQDLSLPAMRRKLLHLYLEWSHAARTAPDGRVWVFGWHEHTNDLFPDEMQGRFLRKLRGPLAEYIDWLNDHFIGRRTPDGRLIAVYANTDQVQRAFLAWEKAHPGESSFHYPAVERDWERYPHRLKHLTWELMYSHHVEEIRALDGQGVHVHKLLRTEGRDWAIRDGAVAATGPTQVCYLVWSERGGTTVDFSGIVTGRLRTVGGRTGKKCVVDATALPLADEPLIVEPLGGEADGVGPVGDAAGRVPIQFRMNVNYIDEEAEARQNLQNLRWHLGLFRELGIKASYWFTGLAVEQIHRLDPEFLRMLGEAQMPVAHHGANRPPNPQPIHRVKGEDWERDVQAILAYESQALDPRTGQLDATRDGGLKRMQELLGGRVAATGRFFQASILYATKELGCRAMIGLSENTGAGTNAGWFLGMKGMPDAHAIAPQSLRRGIDGLAEVFRSIDEVSAGEQDGVRFIAVLLHDTDLLRGPMPARQRVWESYERLVRWVAWHPRLQVVTFEEILDRVADDRTKDVSRDALLKAARAVAAEQTSPPDYIDLGGDTLSLADTFQVLAQSLQVFAETGRLPETAKARDLLGPTEAHRSGLPQVAAAVEVPRVRGEDVVAAAVRVCAGMADRIPARIPVAGVELNPAEFLLAMARTVVTIGEDGKPMPLSLHAVDVLPDSVRQNRKADPLTRLQFWTYKPQRPKPFSR